MLKRLTAICLLLALINSSFSRFLVYAGFELNQKYIAENLCINKSRPWLHCNGKCYFMKKIRQAEENEKKQAQRDGISRLEISFFQEPFIVSFGQPVIGELTQSAYAAYTYHYTSHYLESIFRPPKNLV